MSANKRRGSVRSGGSSTAMASASKKSVRAAEQDRPDVAAARTAWADDQPKLDPDRLVFIDETGTSTKMARLRGRAPRGERLIGKIPHGHWKTTTFVAGLRSTALTAPCVIDGPMNGLPRLCRASPGADPQARRRRRAGQSQRPQGPGDMRSDRSRRRKATLLASLFAGLQSDRAALRKTQSLAAKSRRALRGGPLEPHRIPSRCLPAR